MKEKKGCCLNSKDCVAVYILYTVNATKHRERGEPEREHLSWKSLILIFNFLIYIFVCMYIHIHIYNIIYMFLYIYFLIYVYLFLFFYFYFNLPMHNHLYQRLGMSTVSFAHGKTRRGILAHK